MEYLFGIVILLGALVFFHELGHFLVAKYFKVKVEVFSLGFGTKIIKKKVGETEYCLSLIPLGGYVKLFGEDPSEKLSDADKKRSFSHQGVWRRIAIAAAGPIFNLILAVFVFFCMEIFGLEQVVTGHVAQVTQNSQAWELGLRPGDEITQVNGQKVIRWQKDFLGAVGKSVGQNVQLTVKRKDKEFPVSFIPETTKKWNMFCEKNDTGILKGVSVLGINTRVGLTNPDSWASQSGFEVGDLILSLNGVNVTYWHELKNYLLNIAQNDLKFKVQRDNKTMDLNVKLSPEYFLLSITQKEQFLGLYSYELFIKEDVGEDTAAHKAGLQADDRLVAINDQKLNDWDDLVEKVQTYGNDPGYFYLTYDRGGDLHKVQLFPKKIIQDHPCGTQEEIYQMGIVFLGGDIYTPPTVKPYQQLNPIKALMSSTYKTFIMMGAIFKSVGKMVTGQIPLKAMGGPILIGKIAGDQLKQGLYPFLALLAMISVNLAVLNFLPIPVLDGGHLLLFFCEAIRGRPLSDRVLEYANRAGLALILGLIVLVFYNDISRYWSNIMMFFKNLAGVA